MLSIIRSFGHCQKLNESLSLASSLRFQLCDQLQTVPEDSKSLLYSTIYKVYSVEIEMNCLFNKDDQALSLLHEMSSLSTPPLPIPRSCYLLLFSHFSVNNKHYDPSIVKAKLLEM